MTALSAIEAKIIITALNGIPPSEWEDYLEEKDQRDHYHAVKDHFESIRDYLESYFTGNPKPDFGYLNDLYDGYFIYYLKLYDLIFHCWQDLISIADQENLPESPGRLLIDILESDANRMLSICLSPYRAISIKKARSLLSPDNDPIDLHSPISELSSKQKEKRHYYRSNAIKKDSDQWISILRKIGRKRKKTAKFVKEFDRACGDLQATLNKYLHPSKGIRGGIWEDGKWKPNA